MTIDLEIAEISVRFGGLVAVSDASLLARGGHVTSLIGPNGAGKTTTFNAATGVVVPSAGHVRLGGEPLDGLSPMARAQRGLGRTFQRMELWDSMTVFENIALGPELLDAGRRPWRHLVATRRERADARERAGAAIHRCGIEAFADRSAGELSTGQRRLVELARAMATPFTFLLLDEPSSGLDVRETEHFAAILRAIADEDGIGILLVEHDMALVRAICDHTYVLDFGRMIFDGPTDVALRSELVKAAYLGSEAASLSDGGSPDETLVGAG
jgi:ABC-type branched-subunit amino acid transport system ATPase component